jgi:hypothetical protein
LRDNGVLGDFWLIFEFAIGTWQGETTTGHDPQGKVLGILGMGGIGRVRTNDHSEKDGID